MHYPFEDLTGRGFCVRLMNTNFIIRRTIFLAALLLNCQLIVAQTTTLNKPASKVYKCSVDGKVAYSDTPCLGAEPIDVAPTRGLDKSTGTKIVGQDGTVEKHREIMDEAIKPLAGKRSKQTDVERRRFNLSPESKAECKRLDASIADAEAQARVAQDSPKPQIQQDLFVLRKRYKELKC